MVRQLGCYYLHLRCGDGRGAPNLRSIGVFEIFWFER
jgi:hypothetical protein